jgi:hypothetical protein
MVLLEGRLHRVELAVGLRQPSMVVSVAPWACTASMLQLFIALPSTSTVQAPHCAVSQPTWVPVSCRLLRRNSTRRVLASTSAATGLPFTVSETDIFMGFSSGGIPI